MIKILKDLFWIVVIIAMIYFAFDKDTQSYSEIKSKYILDGYGNKHLRAMPYMGKERLIDKRRVRG